MFSDSLSDHIAHYLLDLLATLTLSTLLALINACFRLLDLVLQAGSFLFIFLYDSTLITEHLSSLVLYPSRECLPQVPNVYLNDSLFDSGLQARMFDFSG